MNNLTELQRRKAELKAKIEHQRVELKKTFLEVREEIEPATLLKKAVKGMFNPSPNKTEDPQPGLFTQLPAPLAFLADLFIRDPRMALLVKLLAPVALKIFPKRKAEASVEVPEEVPVKAKIYGGIRRSISNLRSQLKKKKTEAEGSPEPSTEPGEN